MLGWANHGVPHQPVDVAQPGGVGVAQKARLHGGGAHGKHAQALVGGVTGQVHQHVDLVGLYRLFQGDVVQCGGLHPVLCAPLGQAGVRIVHGACVVDEYLQALGVQLLEQRQHENVYRVLPVQVAGDPTHAQAALGLARIN